MSDYIDALERLGRLREQGVLSDAEFDTEKAKLLSSPFTSEPLEQSENPAWPRSRTFVILAGVVAVVLATAIYLGVTSAEGGSKYSTRQADRSQASVDPQGNAEVRVSGLLKFNDPSQCLPSDELKVVFDELRALEPGELGAITIDGRIPSTAPRVERLAMKDNSSAKLAQLAVRGTWDGLKVVGISTAQFSKPEAYSIQIIFAEGAERVRGMLNGQGFELLEVGKLKTISNDDEEILMGVEGLQSGSALTCARA